MSCFQCEQDGQILHGGIMAENLVPDSLSPWSRNGTLSDFRQVSSMFMYLYCNLK